MMWSLPSSLGSALAVASLVRATVTPRLPSRNPTCCPPGSWGAGGGGNARGHEGIWEGERVWGSGGYEREKRGEAVKERERERGKVGRVGGRQRF